MGRCTPHQGSYCSKICLHKDDQFTTLPPNSGCPHPGVEPPSLGLTAPHTHWGPFLCLLRRRESGVWFSV